MTVSLIAIGFGAALGAMLRWGLSNWLNSTFPSLPPGTLVANLIGGYLIGVAIAVFGSLPDLPPQWRLFITTGSLGGLTTFSTFSAEVAAHLSEGRSEWAIASIVAHVAGSVAFTLLGIGTVSLWRGSQLMTG